MKAVLFVSHRRQQVTVVIRNGDAWDTFEYRTGEHIEVPVLSLTVAVDELYAGVSLDQA